MASTQQVVSSGSDGDQRYAKVDDKKRKRMESNRESARRSRMKKQQRLQELTTEITQLHSQNRIWCEKIDTVEKNYHAVEAENNVVRAQMAELRERLDSLNSLTQVLTEPTELPLDIPEFPAGGFLEPWQQQLPCPTQPINTAYDMMQFNELFV